MRKILILLFMVQMVAIQGMATNRVMRETVPDDSLHTGIWKTDTLKEVNIKGSSILQSGDRMKVAITKDLRRGTVSTIQMLGKLPNFTYNFVDRSLTYHNSSNIIVLVDSVEKDMNYLRNIQHIRFDKVEVIDKPQGQYQGYDVLINLHTKKNYEGYEGMLFNNEGFNLNGENDKKYIFENTTANFSYTKNKWNIYAFAYSYFGQGAYDTSWSKNYLQNGIKETLVNNPDGIRNIITFERYRSGLLSLDYAIQKNQSLSFVYQYGAGRDHDTYNHYTILRTDENTHTETRLTRDIRTHVRDSEHSMAVFYRNNVGRVRWTADFNYRFSPTRSLTDQTESTGFVLNNHFQDHMNFTRFRISGWTNFANGHLTLNAGYENTWKSYKREDNDTGEKLNTNSYLRNRLWASLNWRFDNNAQLMFSGWAEHVGLNNNHAKKTQVPVGGSFMAYYQLTRRNWMRLNYDCSTSYPDQNLSSEYGYFTDSLSWVGGNPWLKTNVTHRINYWIDLWWCFNFQTGYVYSPNSFNSIAEIREGTLPSGVPGKYVASVFQNTDYREWWASVSFTKRFCRDFLYKADLKYRNAKASYHDFSNHIQTVEGVTSLQYYQPRWDMNFAMSYSYSKNFTISPQVKSSSNFENPYVSIQKFLLKKKLELTLTYSLMFHFFNSDMITETKSPGFESRYLDKAFDRQRNRIVFSVSYRFAGGKSVRQYNRDMSTED